LRFIGPSKKQILFSILFYRSAVLFVFVLFLSTTTKKKKKKKISKIQKIRKKKLIN